MSSINREHSDKFLDILLKNIDSVVFIIDDNKKIIEANQAFLNLFELSKEDALSKSYYDIIKCQNDKNSPNCNLCYICDINKYNEGEDIIFTKNFKGGNCKHFILKSQEISISSQSVTMIILNNVTNLIEKTKKLEQLCSIDELTGIFNRRYIIKKLESEIEISTRYKTSLSIIIIDIDNFKEINDSYGHLIGDEVLIKTSDTIKNSLRESDYFGRIGGEEFIIILPNTDLKNAHLCAERIRMNVYNNNFSFHNQKITVSGGVAAHEVEDSLEDFFAKADALLYKAKNTGKNSVYSK